MCSTADDVHRWLKQKMMFDQANISCRTLAKELGCGTDAAREHLKNFYGSEDAGRLKVKATYLVCGRDDKSMADCLASLRIELAEEGDLEDVKAKLHLVSCVELHSVKASQAPDPNLLRSKREVIILKPAPASSPKHDKKATQLVSMDTATKLTDSPSRKLSDASETGVSPNKPAEPKPGKSKPQSAKAPSVTSPADHKQSSTTSKAAEKQASAIKVSSGKRAMSKPTTKLFKPEPERPKVSKSAPAKSKASKSVAEEKTNEQAAGDDNDVTEAIGKCPSPNTSKSKRSAQEDDNSTPSERKRVTKTRTVQKKKIVRVKDLKGYRVNKEVIEEVEETYTDFESEPEDHSKVGRRPKKLRKTADEPENKASENSTSIKSADEKKKGSGISRTGSNLQDEPAVSTTKSKSDGAKKNTSKDQSNITSFFKKS